MAIPVQFDIFEHDFSHYSGAGGLVMGLSPAVITLYIEMINQVLLK